MSPQSGRKVSGELLRPRKKDAKKDAFPVENGAGRFPAPRIWKRGWQKLARAESNFRIDRRRLHHDSIRD